MAPCRRLRALLFGVTIWLALLHSAAARAERKLILELTAPAECASRDALLRAVDQLAQRPPARPVIASARIERRGSTWVLHLQIGEGRREVVGATCPELSQTLAVILALAVDPGARTGEVAGIDLRSPAPAATASAGSVAAGRAAASVTPQATPTSNVAVANPARRDLGVSSAAPSAPRRASASFGVSALMLGETGMLPSPSIGPSLVLRYSVAAWTLELGASGLLRRWAPLPEADSNKGGDISWLGAHLAGCWQRLARSSSSVSLCLGFEAGELRGEGAGVDERRTARSPWLAPLLNTVGRASLSSELAFEARLGLALPLHRPQFGLDGYEPFHRPGALSARALLGLAWR